MPDIVGLDQVATDSDRVMAAWVNAIRNKVVSLEQQLAYANEQIGTLKSLVSNAFAIAPIAGLTANMSSGSIKLSNGTLASIPSQSLTFPNNATSIVFINDSGVVVVSATRPTIGYEIARVVTASNAITSVQQYPLFVVRPQEIDINNLATIAYANSRSWQSVAIARKASAYSIPGRNTYYTVPWETLFGTGWNTGGDFTAPVAGSYIFKVQVRVDTLAVASSPDMASKISLFSGNSEQGVALQQVESARGDLVFNAENAEPLVMAKDAIAQIKIYLTAGTQCRVRENSVCQVWRLPS